MLHACTIHAESPNSLLASHETRIPQVDPDMEGLSELRCYSLRAPISIPPSLPPSPLSTKRPNKFPVPHAIPRVARFRRPPVRTLASKQVIWYLSATPRTRPDRAARSALPRPSPRRRQHGRP